VQLLPVTASSIVLIYNLPGTPQLKLSRKAYAGIFLGKVTKWNDPLIAKDNEGIRLPAAAIHVVVRADSSGTTFALTNHLSAISEPFARSIGPDKMPDWTIGVRAKGNDGVAATVKNTPGAIGYVAYGTAKSGHLPMASLENKAGAFVAPTTASGLAALDSAMVTDDFIVWVTDPEPKNSYPIVTYTWMLCYKRYDQSKHDALIGLLNYGLTDGQKDAESLGYLPLPAKVADKVRAALLTITAI
jgi:phosphate transport system substrate-binding protein